MPPRNHTISSNVNSEITLSSSSTYGSPLTIESGVYVSGNDGFLIAGTHTSFENWTIQNEGTIDGTSSSNPDGIGVYFHYANGLVTNDGTITGARFGVDASGAGGGAVTVDNFGLINSSQGRAIYLLDGGTVTNETGATIAAAYGAIKIIGAAGTVINAGTIAAYHAGGYDGIELYEGAVTNEAGAKITATRYGIKADGTATIDNAGLITASSGGVFLDGGGTVTNESTGTIVGGYGINAQGSTGVTIDNAGYIHGSETGVHLSGGAITNESSGIIKGDAAFVLKGGASVDNFGTVEGAFGVLALGAATIVNQAGGTFTGSDDGIYVYSGVGGTVENAGLIAGSVDAVVFGGTQANRLILDAGATFSGKVVATVSTAANTIELKHGGSVGTLSGLGSEYTGFQTVTIDSGAAWDVAGSISGFGGVTIDGFNSHDQIDLTNLTYNAGDTATVNASYQLVIDDSGGNITIQLDSGAAGYLFTLTGDGSSGTLIEETPAVTVSSNYTLASGAMVNGIDVHNANLTIRNDGTIFGNAGPGSTVGYGIFSNYAGSTVINDGTIHSTSFGVGLNQGGSVINEAHGTITGYDYGIRVNGGSGAVINAGTITGGIFLTAGGSVTNEAGGYIFNEVVIQGAATATFENAGTFNGGKEEAYLGGTSSNLLIVDPGAVFESRVTAYYRGTAANTIELTTGSSIGTLSGLGYQYRGFQTVAIDSGAAWDVTGATTYFAGVTIEGFNSHDQIDLTDLSPIGDTVSLNNSTDLLTIKDSGGDVLATIQLDSGVTGHLFQLLPDGSNGTFVEESDYTPCYCRGTLIRTPDGDRLVESLRIGDLVVTANGEVLPIKWIGRRSYRDWLAVGNPDVQPICFKAGSIADRVPARDLYVSPEHAMYLDGVLVPARHLINGSSILKVEGMEEIEYFHLEFDRHVVILAEGAPAESFVDDDSRMLFHNADEYRRLYPNEPRGRFTEFCAPRVEAGAALETLHRTLATRAAQLRPDGSAAPWGRRGKVELATRTLISGWAFSGVDAGPIQLAILVNGAVVGHVAADGHRADLEAAGIGDGRHGFRFRLPDGLSVEADHSIEVRREVDWTLLSGAPITLAAGRRV